MLTDKRIGVLMGGTSAEREVSLRSGTAVFNALKKLGYDAVAIDAGPDVCSMLKAENIEIAFIVLHGGFGEDGSIQGLLEVMGIPYTGSGVLASALAMDKVASKIVFSHRGIPTARFEQVGSIEEAMKSPLLKNLPPSPVVVKPVREGSSIGVSIVKKEEELKGALDAALSYGDAVIEEYVKGREIQIGILGGRILGGVEVRPKLEFYNYEAKYTPGLTEYILPPELDEAAYGLAKETALRAHLALGCRGATRVDLIVPAHPMGGTGVCDPYVLEVNTIPGMTETSLLPKIARLAGFDFPALIEEMLKETLENVR